LNKTFYPTRERTAFLIWLFDSQNRFNIAQEILRTTLNRAPVIREKARRLGSAHRLPLRPFSYSSVRCRSRIGPMNYWLSIQTTLGSSSATAWSLCGAGLDPLDLRVDPCYRV